MRNSIEVAHYIESELNRIGMKPTELANRIGVDRSTVTRYLKGTRKISMEDIPKIASAIGVSPIDLLLEERPEEIRKNSYDYIPIPVAAGVLTTIDSVVPEEIQVPDVIMGRYAGSKDLFFLKVNGQSMNKLIPHDSMIAVKRIEITELKNDDIVVFSNGHEYSVKRYYNDAENKRYIFHSESTDRGFIDHPIDYDHADELVIHGKVVLYIVSTD